MGILWTLVVGTLIGAIGGAIVGKGEKMGCVLNIAAGLVGSYIGQALLGDWGPKLADMALIPSIIGAVIVVFIVSFIAKKA